MNQKSNDEIIVLKQGPIKPCTIECCYRLRCRKCMKEKKKEKEKD